MDALQRAQNLIVRYAELIDDGDFDGLGALFARGSVSFAPSGLSLHGAAEVASFYQDTVNLDPANGTPGTVHTVSNIHFAALERQIHARSRYQVTLLSDSAAPKLIAMGRYFDHFTVEGSDVYFQQRKIMSQYLGDVSDHLAQGRVLSAVDTTNSSATVR